MVESPANPHQSLAQRISDLDWPALTEELDRLGAARTQPLLSPEECASIVSLYDDSARFRSTIDMTRYRYGAGEYRYFDRPLPDTVTELREAFYPRLLPVAREWAAKLGRQAPWPDNLDAWLDICHEAGQERPTPLLLRYQPGDWNALHRDLYGELVFPLQVVIALNQPGTDYTGGEFLLLEQRPRAQSRGTSFLLDQGEALIFTTRDRPVASKRGWSAAPVRHGVSVLRSGLRHTLGLVFHDAA